MSEANNERQENFVVKYFKDFRVLRETRKEYWGLQLINALDCTAYFAMFNIIVLSLTSDYGFNDIDAGYVFGIFTMTTTIALFLSGVITDWLGIKKALYIAVISMTALRGLLVFAAQLDPSGTRDAIVIGSMFLMAPFMAMIQTVFQAANKRFTTKRSRGAGFNLWYLFMNVGAFGGGVAVDIFYIELGLPRYHIFTLGIVTGILCLIATTAFIHRTDQLCDEGEEPEQTGDEESKPSKSPLQIIKAVASERVFWRFTALITLLLGVRAVFLYLGMLHPKFWTRVIGPDAQIGLLQAFNPLLVIIGLILVIPILNRFGVYKMLVTGALITSVSLFICGIPPFGDMELGRFTYYTTIAFLIVLTVGELIWSPRLSEYTAAIAPEGQEGTYLGLSMVPYFFAKMVVSALSGHMLMRWCPEDIGDRMLMGAVSTGDSPSIMWIVLGGVALAGSLGALLLKDWFTQGAKFEKGRA